MEEKKDTLFSWLWRVVKGALVGTGAILPGISGGVLSVVLGIYRPMMEFLSHPFRSLKKNIKFFLPIVIGFAVGVVLLSKLVDWLFRENELPALWLFIGLILGTVPSLYREAGEQGRSKGAYIALAVAGIFMFAFLTLLGSGETMQIEPNLFWWLICGLLWGIGLIVPGMSPSSIFIFLGLYQPMSAGIAALDLGVILPIGVGLVIMVVLIAKPIKYLFDKHYALMYHSIIGIVIASTLVIMPLEQAYDVMDIVICAVCFVVGAVIAYFMEKASSKLDKSVK
ncbi:MAG: DUF368 domain-containing protein [Clostridiales bacterium]|nr:DUF368 domain-containing protein [Clostridiales bacterium]